jgi:hypothetical protein
MVEFLWNVLNAAMRFVAWLTNHKVSGFAMISNEGRGHVPMTIQGVTYCWRE